MEIVIAAIGRARASPEQALAEQYLARAGALGARLGLGPCRLIETEDRRPGPVDQRRARDAGLLRAALPADGAFVALDETGIVLDSAGFARQLAAWRDQAHRSLGFAIGGPDGLDPELRRSALSRIAFGPMTWPHLLVRAMLAEQLYRAVTILADHPYHRT